MAHEPMGDSGFLAVVLAGVLLAVFWFVCSRDTWFMSHRIMPQLSRALNPLKPTEDELIEAFECKKDGNQLCVRIDPKKLHVWLQQVQRRSALRVDGDE